jgi:uncharacterized repeat protein (TIGR03803 family)
MEPDLQQRPAQKPGEILAFLIRKETKCSECGEELWSGRLIEGLDGNFYGTTLAGGSAFLGVVYRVTRLGKITILHSFNDGSVKGDGVGPSGGLIFGADGDLYGTTAYGGTTDSIWPGFGTIYKITLKGNLTILHNFGDGAVTGDGVNPTGALVLGRDGNFYGTTVSDVTASTLPGGATNGTVFKMTPKGEVTILHHFGDGTVVNDGGYPNGDLLRALDGGFYGTTLYGGGTAPNGYGTIYKITPEGKVTLLHRFHDGTVTNDGASPQAGLVQGRGDIFYGTTEFGGSDNYGVVLKMTAKGKVTILHSFGDGSSVNDGLEPFASFVEAWDRNLYGTTLMGGSAEAGTVFRITPEGTLTVLHSFNDGSVTNDGSLPYTGLAFSGHSDGYLYGTTEKGGSANSGIIFKLPHWMTPMPDQDRHPRERE